MLLLNFGSSNWAQIVARIVDLTSILWEWETVVLRVTTRQVTTNTLPDIEVPIDGNY
jgi:hypothetical protein